MLCGGARRLSRFFYAFALSGRRHWGRRVTQGVAPLALGYVLAGLSARSLLMVGRAASLVLRFFALPLRLSCPRLCAAGLAARALRTAGTGHMPAHAAAKRRETSFSLLQKARLLHNERGFVYTKRIFTRLSLRQTKNVITFAHNWLNYTRTRRRASRPPKHARDAHAVYI